LYLDIFVLGISVHITS